MPVFFVLRPHATPNLHLVVGLVSRVCPGGLRLTKYGAIADGQGLIIGRPKNLLKGQYPRSFLLYLPRLLPLYPRFHDSKPRNGIYEHRPSWRTSNSVLLDNYL